MKRIMPFILAIGLFMLTSCSPALTQRVAKGESFELLVATDLHYLARTLHDDGEAFTKMLAAGDGRLLHYIDEITDAFVRDVILRKPEVLLISGDLTFNGEKASHQALAKKFEEIETEAGTRVYVVPGNHDIVNPRARSFRGDEVYETSSVKPREFARIYQDFGYSEATSRDKKTLSYLAAPSEDVWLLMLDTTQYVEHKGLIPTTGGKVEADTLDWILKCVSEAEEEGVQLVTVMHHNLYNHSKVLYRGYTLDNAAELRAVLAELDLNLVLSGHVHIQDIKAKDESGTLLHDIATSALSSYPVKYGVLAYKSSEGFLYSTDRVDVSGWARENAPANVDLVDFAKYAQAYFASHSYDLAYSGLADLEFYAETELVHMAETMSLLNVHYFGGTAAQVLAEVEAMPGYRLWQDEDLGFLHEYVWSMMQDVVTDHNFVRVPLQQR